MKKLALVLLFFSIILKLTGQSHGITYQAVIIDPDPQEIPGLDIYGNYMPNKALTVRFTIQDENEVIEYQETQSTVTDAYGMINLTIGDGTGTTLSPVSFMEIDWDGTAKDLKVDISLDETSSSFTELSLQRLLFVPYAYHRNITATGTSNLNGQVTIIADVDGGDDQYSSYPLRVEGSNQGIGIRIDGSRNNTNNFITFWDSDGIQGRVEGQTSDDLLSDPQYIFDQSLYAAQVIAQAANLATALGAVAVDPGNAVIEGINSAALAAEIIAYNTFAFENLGVTYESGAGDYAEWLPRLNPEEEIGFGEVVGVYEGKITKTTENADMVMVISKSPIVLGNMPPDSIGKALCEKVGFMGQVPVRVIGKVNKGDYIIAFESGSGLGIAVTPPALTFDMMNRIVGRAWSSAGNSGINYINTLIGVKSGEWIDFIKIVNEKTDALKEEISVLKKNIQQLENKLSKSDIVLAGLVPGYKEAMASDSLVTENRLITNDTKDTSVITVKGTQGIVPNIGMTKESVMERFDEASRILKEQGIDLNKNPFYSRYYSDPEYRKLVVSQILKTHQNVQEQKLKQK